MTSHELVQELRKSSLCGHNLSTNYWYFSDSDAVNLIDARDAAIRAECADRAVAWCKKWAEFPTGNHGTSALRAAIEGQNTIKMNGKTYSYNPEPDVVGEPVGAGEPLDALKAAIEGGQA